MMKLHDLANSDCLLGKRRKVNYQKNIACDWETVVGKSEIPSTAFAWASWENVATGRPVQNFNRVDNVIPRRDPDQYNATAFLVYYVNLNTKQHYPSGTVGTCHGDPSSKSPAPRPSKEKCDINSDI
jgi:hypothetical protein